MAWTDAARAASAAVRRAHAKGRAKEVRAGNRRLAHVYTQSVANVMNTYKKPSKGLARRLMRMAKSSKLARSQITFPTIGKAKR